MTQKTVDYEALEKELENLMDPFARLSAGDSIRGLISSLARRIEDEDNEAFSLWSWLPSYATAEANHGDYAGEHRPSILEIMDEATKILAEETAPGREPSGENAIERLWSILPSYREAVRYHGDGAFREAPFPADVMKEASMVFGDLRYPEQSNDAEVKAVRAEWYRCPCGEPHDMDAGEE